MTRTRVKVCCISTPNEARVAVAAGADALGLVSATPSGPGVIAGADAIAAQQRATSAAVLQLVGEAILMVWPFGVDVCSGVRTRRQLDSGKRAAFVQAVARAYARATNGVGCPLDPRAGRPISERPLPNHMNALLGSDPLTIGLGAAFGLAGFMYWWWILGGAERLRDLTNIRVVTRTNRLLGRFSERDPADDVQQSLSDALRGAPEPAEPDDDLWLPDVRQLDGTPRQPDARV